MKRAELLQKLQQQTRWDMIIIGGGATGLGAAVEAASRGYSTLLLEGQDFASGTSGRSTKLIHGGVRYLQQGNIALVLDALHERGLLIRNAPHLVQNRSFIVPLYDWWEGPFYGVGLKLYDALAGKLGLGPSQLLSRAETLKQLPTLEEKSLHGGVIYHDGQFDDARLAIALARTAVDQGATVINHLPVTALIKQSGQVFGVIAKDVENGREYELHAKVVINATGPFCDTIRRFDDPAAAMLLAPSQGIHLVLPRAFLPGESAIMVPHTDDGRVLFAVPWHERVLLGTTDTPVDSVDFEPRPLAAEIDFLLQHAARYLREDPQREDILSIFAGLRPLVKNGDSHDTASLSRDHTLLVSHSGLVSITGGKWTTYRKMGEETINLAARIAVLPERPSRSAELPLHGADAMATGEWASYGSDAAGLEALCVTTPSLRQLLHPALPYRRVEIIWAIRHEWASSVEDLLSRRTRALILDARAAIAIAPTVAALLAVELGRDDAWQAEQIAAFTTLAQGYLP
ncbi:MAG: FAD-dependent oxidoreductase [Deltaproteobacteria bacterium HGW-Deltaproteobacteria-4]|nr:MAG: FAD-dependent oxidoreductase [Deltaproteobacteria bacterium HGW-Deltaproteobacteria-4]